jgi:deoxyribonuclease V
MKIQGRRHAWDVPPGEAVRLQKSLASELDLASPLPRVSLLAGADCAIDMERNEVCAAVVLLSFPALDVLETVSARRAIAYPYVPGLLTFREGPVLLDAFKKLSRPPDVVVFDGQGIAHPRRLGIAAHMGLWLATPTIGCGKSLLCGAFDPPGRAPGSASPLIHREERVGFALTTREGCRPVFVSPGHRVSAEGALDFVRRCLDGYRIPKPTRLADRAAAEAKRV